MWWTALDMKWSLGGKKASSEPHKNEAPNCDIFVWNMDISVDISVNCEDLWSMNQSIPTSNPRYSVSFTKRCKSDNYLKSVLVLARVSSGYLVISRVPCPPVALFPWRVPGRRSTGFWWHPTIHLVSCGAVSRQYETTEITRVCVKINEHHLQMSRKISFHLLVNHHSPSIFMSSNSVFFVHDFMAISQGHRNGRAAARWPTSHMDPSCSTIPL